MLAIDNHSLDTGTDMKMNNHFHGVSSARRPANKAPNHPPTGAPAPKNPRLRLRILPGGRVVPIIAIALGTIIAAPMPLKALATLKATKLLQNALIKDHKIHHIAPPSKILLWPYIEPSRPVMITKAPEVSLKEDAGQFIHQASEFLAYSRVRSWNPRCIAWSIDTERFSDNQSTSNTKTERNHLPKNQQLSG